MSEKICENCFKLFNTNRKEIRFCSKGCATSFRQDARDLNFMKEEGEFKYYALGLIYSDGCISKQKNKREILTIELKDEELIKKMKPLMSPNRKLYITKPKKETHSSIYRIINSSKDALKELKDFGLMYRKTKKITMPILENNEQLRHFVRGYFDGDGSIFFNKIGGFTYRHISITTGSYSFAIGFQKALKEVGFDFKINQDSRNKECYYLKLYKKDDVKNFGEWMYLNSEWYLKRKYNRFFDDIV